MDDCVKEGDGINRKKRDDNIVKFLRFVGITSLVLCMIFIIILFLIKNYNIQIWYQKYLDYLISAEYKVENMNDKHSVFLVIIFLYCFKAFFPIYLFPISALCTVASAVFPAYFSIPINLFGLASLYTIKYFWGARLGASTAQALLQKSKTVRYIIEKDGYGNPWLLSLFRLVPGIPINLVSQLYGAMGFRFKHYLILSLIGYAPLLISYTFIGRNMFNPLSTAFLLPFVLLFLLIGVSMLTISKIFQIQTRRRQNNG